MSSRLYSFYRMHQEFLLEGCFLVTYIVLVANKQVAMPLKSPVSGGRGGGYCLPQLLQLHRIVLPVTNELRIILLRVPLVSPFATGNTLWCGLKYESAKDITVHVVPWKQPLVFWVIRFKIARNYCWNVFIHIDTVKLLLWSVLLVWL